MALSRLLRLRALPLAHLQGPQLVKRPDGGVVWTKRQQPHHLRAPLPIGPTTSCVAYGWFGGCLETTTISPTSTSMTTTTLTSTSCAKAGWFGGCVETTTTTLTTTTPVKEPEMWTTSCAVYGWLWGCESTTTIPLLPTPTPSPTPVTKCLTRNFWGWGWCVKSTTLYPESTLTSTTALVPTVTTTRPIAQTQMVPRPANLPTAAVTPYPDLR